MRRSCDSNLLFDDNVCCICVKTDNVANLHAAGTMHAFKDD